MGSSPTCAKCGKGIGKYEKIVIIDESAYHAKCAQRLERGRR